MGVGVGGAGRGTGSAGSGGSSGGSRGGAAGIGAAAGRAAAAQGRSSGLGKSSGRARSGFGGGNASPGNAGVAARAAQSRLGKSFGSIATDRALGGIARNAFTGGPISQDPAVSAALDAVGAVSPVSARVGLGLAALGGLGAKAVTDALGLKGSAPGIGPSSFGPSNAGNRNDTPAASLAALAFGQAGAPPAQPIVDTVSDEELVPSAFGSSVSDDELTPSPGAPNQPIDEEEEIEPSEAQPVSPDGVTYLTPVTDRETGEVYYMSSTPFSASLRSRRNSFGGNILRV